MSVVWMDWKQDEVGYAAAIARPGHGLLAEALVTPNLATGAAQWDVTSDGVTVVDQGEAASVPVAMQAAERAMRRAVLRRA